MSRRHLWAAAFREHVLTLGNDTNNRVESSHKQMKRYLLRSDSLHQSMLKVHKWFQLSNSRIEQESMIAQSRSLKYSCSERIIPILRHLTPYTAKKVIADYAKRRWTSFQLEGFDYIFLDDNGRPVEVDLRACTCTCMTFQTCRYPCRHLLM
ncbi:unnamed protein product, partial [Trichobilharzia szidati]